MKETKVTDQKLLSKMKEVHQKQSAMGYWTCEYISANESFWKMASDVMKLPNDEGYVCNYDKETIKGKGEP